VLRIMELTGSCRGVLRKQDFAIKWFITIYWWFLISSL